MLLATRTATLRHRQGHSGPFALIVTSLLLSRPRHGIFLRPQLCPRGKRICLDRSDVWWEMNEPQNPDRGHEDVAQVDDIVIRILSRSYFTRHLTLF